jgi:secreted PhoX family phosphatase
MHTTRRHFMRQFGASVLGAGTLTALQAHTRWAHAGAIQGGVTGYGALHPLADQRGTVVLALPQGFSYVTFSHLGEAVVGGTVARNLDGMAAFSRPDGTVRLIRNHEVRNKPGDAAAGVSGPDDTRYDRLAMGGCHVLDIDPVTRKRVREFVGLNGTLVNCAGGYAWKQRGWLSCEETTDGPAQGYAQKHGYVFYVPATLERAHPAQPLKALGRFKHEAATADRDGIVYLTEDAGPGHGSGFYRFVPREASDLSLGGSLQMLQVRRQPQYDARQKQRADESLACDWVTIPISDPDLEAGAPGCFAQGVALGGARFNRLEGLWLAPDGRSAYFVSTSGGDAKQGSRDADGFAPAYGQIWHYQPTSGQGGLLKRVFESPAGSVLDSPDNLCVTPRGGLLVCEDDASPDDNDRHALATEFVNVNRLVGLGQDGQPFAFAVNLLNNSELAGACFSPDGNILFVNVFGDGTFGSGMTCAITGPWQDGPL